MHRLINNSIPAMGNLSHQAIATNILTHTHNHKKTPQQIFCTHPASSRTHMSTHYTLFSSILHYWRRLDNSSSIPPHVFCITNTSAHRYWMDKSTDQHIAYV